MSDLVSQDWQHCPTCDGMCFTEGGLCDNCRGFGQVPVDYTEHVDLGVGSVDDVIAMLRSQRDRAEEHLYAARQRVDELRAAAAEALRWVECVGGDPYRTGCDCGGCQARYALSTVLFKPDAGCAAAVELSRDEFDEFMGHVREARLPTRGEGSS